MNAESAELRVRHVPRHRRPGLPASGRHPSTGAPKGLLQASMAMASGSLVSRALGFVRNYLFGAILAGSASAAANAFSAANTLPNTIWVLVGGGTLNAILVPAIVRAVKRPDNGSDYISRLMTLVATAALAVTALCMLLVPALLILTSGVLPPATYALAIQLGLWMMPQIFFSALYVMCGQLLNAHDSFGPYQWAPALNNVVAILGAVVFLGVWGTVGEPDEWTFPMIVAMAIINVGGSAAQVVFLLWYVSQLGLRLRPKWGMRGLGLGKLSRIGLWTLGMLGLGQLGLWAGRWAVGGAVRMNETLREHPLEAAHYPGLLAMEWAYLAFMIPQGIIAVSIVTAVFPGISRHAAAGEHTGAMARYAETNRMLAVPMILCTALFCALSGPIMWVIGGGTGRTAAEANSHVLVAYMLGLLPFASLYLVKRVFYAYEDARTPFLVQVPMAVLTVLAAPLVLMLVDPRWAATAAAGVSSATNFVSWFVALRLMRRQAIEREAMLPDARRTIATMGRLALAGVVAWAVGAGGVALLGDVMWTHRLVALLLGCVLGAVVCAVFTAVAWALRVEELRTMVAMAARRIPGRRRSSS